MLNLLNRQPEQKNLAVEKKIELILGSIKTNTSNTVRNTLEGKTIN